MHRNPRTGFKGLACSSDSPSPALGWEVDVDRCPCPARSSSRGAAEVASCGGHSGEPGRGLLLSTSLRPAGATSPGVLGPWSP